MPVVELSYLLVATEAATALASGEQAELAAAPPPLPPPSGAARYTRSLLRQTLQLMGIKPRQSDKAAQKVFLILQQRAALPPSEALSLAQRLHAGPEGHAGVTLSRPEFDKLVLDCLAASDQPRQERQQQQPPTEVHVQPPAAVSLPPGLPTQPAEQQPTAISHRLPPLPPPLQQHRASTATAAAAAATAATAAAAVTDFHIACALREQRTSVAVLLCGTSGTGKSTLASLLAARLGISTVVSTDSIRHMMRSFCNEAEDPLLWASTYEAGAHLQAAAGAAQASARSPQQQQAAHGSATVHAPPYQLPTLQQLLVGASDPRKAAIRGYKAQSARVLEHVDRLLTGCEARRQSVVVEGVHLSLSMVVRMMQRHPSVVPFLVHISNESKHMERFAVRSKVMTLREDGNRYVKYFRNIRAIQDYLVKSAEKHAIPKVDNTNVDRSVATIHTTVLGCLRRTARGESMLSGTSLSCKLLLEEYLRCKSATWSSSDMLELIRSKSTAGRPPSPSEDASSATHAASTPHGPLSDGASEEQLRLASSRNPSTLVRSNEAGPSVDRVGAGQEDEGDNRSFYGSENQSSSDEGGSSRSCSSSSGCESAEDEDAGLILRARTYDHSSSGGSAAVEQAGADDGSDGMKPAAAPRRGGDALGMLGLPRRHRHRERRQWRMGARSGGSGSSSAMGEIPAGLVPESMRRRSEVGSVLESEQHSDTEEAEFAAGPALAVQA